MRCSRILAVALVAATAACDGSRSSGPSEEPSIGTAQAVTSLAQCGTVVNGGFEAGNVPGPGGTPLFPGTTDLTGWQVLPQSVDWIDFVGNVVASEGRWFLDLSGDVRAGGIRQTVCTRTNGSYALSFDLSVNPSTPGFINAETVRVTIGERSTDVTTPSYPGGSTPAWIRHRIVFTATSSSTLIRFRSLGSDNTGPLIDNVQLRVR
jgi:choice-of-anchor C domain-containing protein